MIPRRSDLKHNNINSTSKYQVAVLYNNYCTACKRELEHYNTITLKKMHHPVETWKCGNDSGLHRTTHPAPSNYITVLTRVSLT
jgi:hypothetical protein